MTKINNKLYKVIFPFTGTDENRLIRHYNTGSTWSDSVDDNYAYEQEGYQTIFTEDEIKEIDTRYWLFAVEIND